MDCIYTYNGQQYTYAELIKKLAEKDLASLKERGLVSVDEKTFEGSLSSPTIFKAIKETMGGDNHAVVETDSEGTVVPVETIKGKRGTFDESGVRKFTDDVNDIYRENHKTPGDVKVVVADAKTFNEVHKEYYDGAEASDTDEAFYDEKTKTMYINASQASLDATMHESTHIWFHFIENRSPQLFKAGIDIAKATKQFDNFIDYKNAYRELKAKYTLEGKKNAKELALEQAKNQVVLDNKNKYLYNYYDAAVLGGEKGETKLANEILTRETENAFKSKKDNVFSKWYNSVLKSFADTKGFKGMTIDQINKLSLKQFASKLAEETSGGIRTESGKARMATTKLEKELTQEERAKAQEKTQEPTTRRGRGVSKEEVKPEPIYAPDVVDILRGTSKGKEILKKAELLFEQSGLLQQYAENEGMTLESLSEAEASILSEKILGDIMVGNLRVPSEFANPKSIGTLSTRRGNLPSGLIGEAFKELGDGLSIASGQDITSQQIKKRLTNEVKPTTAEAIPFAKAKASYKTEEVDSGIKSREEQIIDEINDLQSRLETENLEPENKKAIRKQINDLVAEQQKIAEKQGKVYGGGQGIELIGEPTETAPTKGTAEAPKVTATSEAPEVTVKEVKPAKPSKIQKYQEEIDYHMGEIEYLNGEIEGIEEEIQLNKGDLKDDLEKLKEKLDRAKKTKLPKDEKEELIEGIKAEIEDAKDDMDIVIENYKDDIKLHKEDIKKAQRAIKKLEEKIANEQAASAEKPIKKITAEEEEEAVDSDYVQIRSDQKKLARRAINFKNWLLPADRKLPISALSKLEEAQGMKQYYEKTNVELLNILRGEMGEYLSELGPGKDEDGMGTAQGLSTVIDRALKGDKAAFDLLTPKLKTTVDLMRANIDNASEFVMSSGWLSAAELSEYQKNLGTYVARIYEKYTSPSVPVSKKIKDTFLSKIPGIKSLVKEDKPIANAQWVKDLSPEQIYNAKEGFKTWVENGYSDTQADKAAGTGFKQRKKELTALEKAIGEVSQKILNLENAKASGTYKGGEKRWQNSYDKANAKADALQAEYQEKSDSYSKDVETEARKLYEDAIQHVEKGQFMETANGSINMKQFLKRKDLPQWYREIIGESNNVFKNYFYTIGRLQNLGNKLQLHSGILELGLQNGFIVKGNARGPQYKNFVLVGGESAYPGATKKLQGPLYGYKMDPLLYKAMFEMPSFVIGDETLQANMAQQIGNVYMGSVDIVNMAKVSLNLSSLIRNVESYFKGAFMLSGTYSDLIRTSYSLTQKGSNFLYDGTLYYENRSAEQKGKTEGYIKGLAQDALQDGATGSIGEDALRQWIDILNKDDKFEKALKLGDKEALYKQLFNSMGYMVKASIKGLQKFFILGDVAPKILQYEVKRNTIANDIYGKNFYQLDEKQMKAVREASALDVKEDFATPTRAAEFGRFRGVGTFARYRYEMYRTFYNTGRQLIGYDLDKSYKHIKFSDNKAENQDMVNRLARNKRRTKMIGFITFSGALQGGYALMNGIFNSNKRDDQVAPNGVISNAGLGQTNLAYEAYKNAKNIMNGEASMRQTVQLILPDYLYDKNIEYTYDPKTKKMIVLNLSQNDQFSPITDWMRGLMYDKSPSDRTVADYKGLGVRTFDMISDQLQTFGGLPVVMLQAIKTGSDKKIASKAQSEGYINKLYVNASNFMQGVAPGDMSTYTKNNEMMKYANKDWIDAAGKTFEDVIVSGFRGKKMEINVYSSISGRVGKEHERASEAIINANTEVERILNLASTRFTKPDGSPVYSFYDVPSFDDKQKILDSEFVKGQIDEQVKILNNLLRASIKANKIYYNAAKKFSFTKEELEQIFKDANNNRVEVGKIKGDILFEEDYLNVMQLTEKQIDNLNFKSMIYSLD